MRRWRAVFLLLLIPAAMRATTLLPMYMDDLTAASQTVAYGTVIASRVEWDQGRNWIYTIYTIQPAQYLKGQLGTAFELREPGGELDGIAMVVAGVPHFEVGQEAALFVWTDPTGHHQVSGFEQGAVPIETDAATGSKTARRAMALGSAPAAGAVASDPSASYRLLPQLLDQIRASVAKNSVPPSKE